MASLNLYLRVQNPLGQRGGIKRFQLALCDLDKTNAKQHRLLNTGNGA